MAYGITSPNQFIDIDAIKSGCQKLVDSVQDFETCGKYIIEAGNTCSKKALAVDGGSLEGEITEVGDEIASLKDAYIQCVEAVMQQAVNVYNQQVNEYNEYVRRQNEEAQRRNNNK